MKGIFQNLKIAILVCDGFEEREMVKPRDTLVVGCKEFKCTISN